MSLRNQQGVTLIELMMVVGILMLISSAVLTAINPKQRLLDTWDAGRIASVVTLKNAIESYETLQGAPPSCDSLPDCPTNFEITGTDYVSSELLTYELLKTIPERVGENTSNLCNFQVFLYPEANQEYYLRWCYESWTEADVTEANAISTGYNCTWAPVEELAYCITSSSLDVPPPKL